MQILSVQELRKKCPVKWHKNVPEDGISLGVADVDFKGPDGALSYLKENLVEDFSFYQDQQGLPSAVSAATNFLQQKNIDATSDNVQIIDGTMMGIYISMKWISQKPGDLLVLGPIYDPIHRHASSNGNQLQWTPITKEGINEEHIKQMLDGKQIKMITMCNPTNPIGHVFSSSELKFIRDMVIDHDLYVFADELYEPLWFDKPQQSIAAFDDMQARSLMLYGFSKAYGLAGYRSGFMHIGADIDDVKFIASQQMVSPSPVASIITDFALTDPRSKQWVEDFRNYAKNITKFAARKFEDAGISCSAPEGCFFVFPDLEVNDVEFVPSLLKNKGVQVVEGSKFGPTGKGHVRINCATSEERLSDGIQRILSELETFR